MEFLARRALIGQRLAPGAETLLLEGSWPAHRPEWHSTSLDEAIDARQAWIDAEACRLAEQAAEACESTLAPVDGSSPAATLSLARVNALKLRYYFVKLLRVVAYVQGRRVARGDWRFVGARRRDEDYAELLQELALARGAKLHIQWIDGNSAPAPSPPLDGLARRAAAWLHHRLDGPLPQRVAGQERIAVCGNPSVLGPVCRELLSRGAALWWLYDRFAYRSCLQWRRRGVRQLVLNSCLGRQNRLADGSSMRRLEFEGIDLAGPLRIWLANLARTVGPSQTRMIEQIDEHFRRVRPDWLLVDEDATPLPRGAISVGQRFGVRSAVVQHGVPCLPFGFAPLAADRFLTWGPATRRTLLDWGVAADAIEVTGSPRHDAWRPQTLATIPTMPPRAARRLSRRAVHILLLTTVPPRDERPDSVAFHFTTAAHDEMLRMTCAALSRIGNARLLVKLHPRAGGAEQFRRAFAAWPALTVRWVKGDLRRWVAECDCVLSCASSSGVEAAALGAPVIQLWPRGGADLLPAADWGFAGTARDERELDRLLFRVLGNTDQCGEKARVELFADVLRPAARRAADVLLSREPRKSSSPKQRNRIQEQAA